MLLWLQEKWRAWRHKRVMLRLRKTLAWFGVSTQHLSDEDIAAAIVKHVIMFKSFGISASEVAKGFEQLSAIGIALEKGQK